MEKSVTNQQNFQLKLIGSTALIDGDDSPLKKSVMEALGSLGMSCYDGNNSESEDLTPDFYCVISHYIFHETEVSQKVDRNRVLAIANRMKAKGQGRMVLITNNASEFVYTPRMAEQASAQSSDTHWWRHMAVDVARNNISANILSLGYLSAWGNELSDNSEKELIRRLSVRRPVQYADLKAGLNFLASEDASYIIGQTINLDGGMGLKIFPPPPTGEEKYKHTKSQLAENEAPFDMAGKTALIVGCSSGIGRATAVELAMRGAKVILSARSEQALSELAEEITQKGGDAIAMPCDVLDEEAITNMVDQAWETVGPIDNLIYSAGYMPLETMDFSKKALKRTLGVNYFGLIHTCEALMQHWIKEKRPGNIVSIASITGSDVPTMNLEYYGSSKAAVLQYIRTFSASHARHKIRANVVLPGVIQTAMTDWVDRDYMAYWQKNVPSGRLGVTPDIAGAISYLASPASEYITGSTLYVDGGYNVGMQTPID